VKAGAGAAARRPTVSLSRAPDDAKGYGAMGQPPDHREYPRAFATIRAATTPDGRLHRCPSDSQRPTLPDRYPRCTANGAYLVVWRGSHSDDEVSARPAAYCRPEAGDAWHTGCSWRRGGTGVGVTPRTGCTCNRTSTAPLSNSRVPVASSTPQCALGAARLSDRPLWQGRRIPDRRKSWALLL
jgi:hypothetical protein